MKYFVLIMRAIILCLTLATILLALYMFTKCAVNGWLCFMAGITAACIGLISTGQCGNDEESGDDDDE